MKTPVLETERLFSLYMKQMQMAFWLGGDEKSAVLCAMRGTGY